MPKELYLGIIYDYCFAYNNYPAIEIYSIYN